MIGKTLIAALVAAVALGRVTFDGAVLVAGFNNHPTRPAPFIRQDFEF